MQVNGTAPLSADIVGRTIMAVEILTSCDRQTTKHDDSFFGSYIEDEYGSAPDIEYYNNYTKTGNGLSVFGSLSCVKRMIIHPSDKA